MLFVLFLFFWEGGGVPGQAKLFEIELFFCSSYGVWHTIAADFHRGQGPSWIRQKKATAGGENLLAPLPREVYCSTSLK